FEEFFGPQFRIPRGPNRQQEFRQPGLGTGFIIDPDGTILTNSHVVADSDEIEVIMDDGTTYDAKLLGSDPESEVAVIKIDAKNLKYLEPGNSDEMRVGNFVVAIGNPQGLSQSVSFGIVSAINRSEIRITDFSNFIQTDAAINMGNSGGPLLNADGKVIGINTAIVSTSGGSQGLGFAIPVNQAIEIAQILKTKGKMERGYLGIWMQELSPEMAEFLSAKDKTGAVVLQIMPDAPAQGQLKVDDAIIAVEGENVEGSNDVMNRIASMMPGDKVDMTVIRDGKRKKVTVKLGTRPSRKDLMMARIHGTQPGQEDAKGKELDLGFTVEKLTQAKAREIGFEEEKQGLLVTNVDVKSKAYKNGLRENMVIEQVNRQDVSSLSGLNKALDAEKAKKHILLRVITPIGAQLILIPREEN
ncbi:MAG: Do family serine endopeptidase, partial [Candidatus Sumerlaeota bacterium]